MWILLSSLVLVFVTVKSEELDSACLGNGPRTIQVKHKGNLLSPGFVENQRYPPNLKCSYQLQAPSDMHVRIKFNTLDIDPVEDCTADNLSIIDFYPPSGINQLLKVHCGKNIPEDYVSSWFVFQLDFETNSFGSRRGFNISYSAVYSSDLCDEDEQLTCRNRKCVDLENKCDGTDDCGDGTDEEPDDDCEKEVEEGECGVPDINPLEADNDRIVGGKQAIPNSWPWMVEIQKSHIEPGHFCGGTLINNQWVLAAAHCFGTYRKPSQFRIHLGKHHKYDKDEHEVIRYAKRLIIYNDIEPEIFEENGKFNLDHDIALIQLNAPVEFSKYIKPACLPDSELELDKDSKCYATGWGHTKGIGSDTELKQTYHPIQPDRYCNVVQYKPETMICAGSLAADDGICSGDSGGPLICKIGNEWTVTGVSSFIQRDCGATGLPSVFNKISAKVHYIKDMIEKYS